MEEFLNHVANFLRLLNFVEATIIILIILPFILTIGITIIVCLPVPGLVEKLQRQEREQKTLL